MGNVIIGADHRGYRLKSVIVENLRERGISVEDLGSTEYDPTDDFVDIAIKLGEKVVAEKAKGILICRNGVGVCIAVNKVRGVRAGLCMSIKQARLAKSDDDINVLCLSSELITQEKNIKIVNKFLNTVFSSEERFIRRIQKISKYES